MNMAMDCRLDQEEFPRAERYSVVIADDDCAMAELLATNLRRLGHRVVGIAMNGREAVDMVLELRPDAVLMDIRMPALDGLQASREILAVRQMPILISTGISDPGSVHEAIDLKVVSYLVKPFSPAQLNVALQLAVAQCRGIARAESASAAA